MNVVRAGTSVSALLIQPRGTDRPADQNTGYNACATKESSMNTDLTQDQIDSYQQNGFVVLHDFLTPKELETWRQAVDAAVRRRGKQRMFNQEEDEDREESYYDYVFVQRVNLWQDSLDVRRLILDPRLGKMASDLAGVEGVRIWHDQALIKQPWANPTGWHLDNPYWSYSSRETLSLWVALDDATLQNGCLYFLPGSHKTATYDNASIGENIGDIFRVYPQWQDIMAVSYTHLTLPTKRIV